jgi:spoIIIJ-associated protein
MSHEKTTLEVIAPTVEEAVESGLNQLGLPREAVHVEVLDSGSRGLFGLGGRQARIRLTIQMADEPVVNSDSAGHTSAAQAVVPAPINEAAVPVSASMQEEESLKVATQVVRDLLERMKVNARVSAHFLEPEDAKDQLVVMVEIQGDDLSILIGRRSETLNALQYITSLIVCKELGKWTPIMIDVQGYRSRRERQLRQLARRMADQAVHTGRRQVLEPMPANERRLIHLELRDHPQVTTESVGEEPGRKVTISLKK